MIIRQLRFGLLVGLILFCVGCGQSEQAATAVVPVSPTETVAPPTPTPSVTPSATATLTPIPTNTMTPTAEPTETENLTPIALKPEIVAVYDHDQAAFTQGLLWYDGGFYESTGLRGESSLRRVTLAGEVVQFVPIEAQFFAEGLALVDDRFIQLTWQLD